MVNASKEEARLEALHRYGILDTPDEADFDDLVRLAAQICEVPIALISLVDRERLWFKAKLGVDACGMPRESSFCSYAVADECLIVPDARLDARFADHPVVTGPASFRYYAGVCLMTPDGYKLGTLCVLDRRPRDLTTEQLDALRALSRQVMGQLELRRMFAQLETRTRALTTELEVAASLQVSILPSDSITVPGLEIATHMQPAAEVGGDYYDVIPTADGCWIGIGDVSGHGLGAGVVMLMMQSVIAALVRACPDLSPAALDCLVNDVLFENVRRRMKRSDHATLSVLRYRHDGVLRFAGAHEEILVWRAKSKTIERVETPGTWVGATRSIAKATVDSTIQLDSGDLVVLYTDGITEARRRGEQFGLDRLCGLVLETAELPTERIKSAILGAVRKWSPSVDDDVSLVIVRRT